MSHSDLHNYMQTTFWLHYKHGFDIAYIEKMMVWEKDYYVNSVIEAEKAKAEKN